MMITETAYAPGLARDGAISATLTNRELEVLRLMADGLRTKEIAVRLDVSFKTAACHRYRILQKLCVESTVSAVRWAIRQGIVEP
jgi:DNA-binding NarL/FixJ family response regulator